jgi:hypothetical protein
MALVIAIAGLRFALRAAAWSRCLEEPHALRLADAVGAAISGDALGNATPLGPLVGEPAKVAFVRRSVPLGAAFTALAIENLFYSLSVAAMIAAGTIAALLRGGLAGDMRLAAELAIAIVLGGYVVVAWMLWRKPAFLSTTVSSIAGRWRAPALHARLEKIRRLEQDIYTFAARRRGAIVPLITIELAFHALGVLEVYVTLWLLTGSAPPVVTAFILETVNRLVTVVGKPIPGQPGLNEGATVLMSQIVGLSNATLLTVAVVRRVRMLFWQLVGMGLLVRHGLTTRRILQDGSLVPDPHR